LMIVGAIEMPPGCGLDDVAVGVISVGDTSEAVGPVSEGAVVSFAGGEVMRDGCAGPVEPEGTETELPVPEGVTDGSSPIGEVNADKRCWYSFSGSLSMSWTDVKRALLAVGCGANSDSTAATAEARAHAPSITLVTRFHHRAGDHQGGVAPLPSAGSDSAKPTINVTSPNWTRSRGPMSRFRTSRPLTKVPFRDRASMIDQTRPSRRRKACRGDTLGSGMQMSHDGSFPIVMR
jgi:hypothetical protein